MNLALEASSRDRILDVALVLFARQGYAGTSMRQIAGEVGMRASSLYSHFAGKEAILSALIDAYGPARGASRLASPAYRALADDPAAFCRRYAADWLDQWCDVNERRFMGLLNAEPSRMADHRAHFVETLFDREVVAVADYFRRFIMAGRMRPGEPADYARLFMGGMTFVRMQHLMMPPEPSPREVIAEALAGTVEAFLKLVVVEA
ncbi:TetR/AcrR family transcriptional regulator [Phenylobacterium sp.]|uniref:TetR/AcrR family transcriptional regulator n=1 Tax=Phenylobacterium sp. TaxID=1871053 RepID=UPI0035B2981D